MSDQYCSSKRNLGPSKIASLKIEKLLLLPLGHHGLIYSQIFKALIGMLDPIIISYKLTMNVSVTY